MKDLKRDIYESLLEWKKNYSGKVLEVEGARQVGKTYNKVAVFRIQPFLFFLL